MDRPVSSSGAGSYIKVMRFRGRSFVYLFTAIVLASMYSQRTLLLGSTFTALGLSQSSSSSSMVPAGTALAGDYSGPLRPQIHFSAPQGFINDPNGMFIDENKTWHLYYQYNPSSTIAGNQHWGHATSQDLYRWENQAIALAPANRSEGIFSGSAVVDVNNTSGFFPHQSNGVLAYYTLNAPGRQTQDLAYSVDGGYTFTKYEHNPVIDVGSSSFRDPKVFWYQDHWVMVVSFVLDFAIGIWTSANGIEWENTSNFSHHGLLGTQFECPNLVEMPMQGSDTPMWLMYISIQPGAPLGGSIGQYYPGTFNGTHFEAVDAAARIADWGKDNYASQFFSGIPGREKQVSIAWASNWQYANLVPTGPHEGWQSTMSLPRTNYLKNATITGYTLVSLPYGLDTLRGQKRVAQNPDMGPTGSLSADLRGGSGAFLLDVNITGLNVAALSPTASVNFTITSNQSGEAIRGGAFLGETAVPWVDRGGVRGWDSIYNTNRFSAALLVEDSFDLQVVIDRSILEMFTLEGEKSATLVYYPEAMLDSVTVTTGGLNQDVQVSASVHSLQGTWGTGLVQPNSTSVQERGLFGSDSWSG